MAGLAKGHEIIIGMGTAAINGEYMVDFIGGDEAASFEASLAERVLGNIQVPDVTPAPTVDFVTVGGAAVAVVLAGSDGLVRRTVTAFPDGLGTAGVGAGF